MKAGLGPSAGLPTHQTRPCRGSSLQQQQDTPSPGRFLTASHLQHVQNLILIGGQLLVFPDILNLARISAVCFFPYVYRITLIMYFFHTVFALQWPHSFAVVLN